MNTATLYGTFRDGTRQPVAVQRHARLTPRQLALALSDQLPKRWTRHRLPIHANTKREDYCAVVIGRDEVDCPHCVIALRERM